jgi:hypothetical protein
MKFASFDLETHIKLPDEEGFDENVFNDIHISCAAVAYSNKVLIDTWHDYPYISKIDCGVLVTDLLSIMDKGYTIVTWNGTGFDFKLLAYQSGLFKECQYIAENHIDMMLYVTFTKGWYLGLDKALEGAGFDGKLKKVTLSNGDIIENMKGEQAPELWRNKEFDAVLDYLFIDVKEPLYLIDDIMESKKIEWTSNSGKRQRVFIDELLLVKDCFNIPEPDTSWMTNPPTRLQFIDWFPDKADYSC